MNEELIKTPMGNNRTGDNIVSRLQSFNTFKTQAKEQKAQQNKEKMANDTRMLFQSGLNATDDNLKKVCDKECRKNLAGQMILNYYNSNGNHDWDSRTTTDILNGFISANQDTFEPIKQFVNSDQDEIEFGIQMGWISDNEVKQAEEQKLEETGWQKAGDFAVGVAQSPGKWGYNIIGQWMDKAGKALADKLQGTSVQKAVQDLAIDIFGEDEVKAYQQQKQKQLEEGTAFDGRTQTDITTPILGEERAKSGWTKGGEIVGDIASGIALTAPIAAATAPAYAAAGGVEAASLGALEGLLDTAITTYGATGSGPSAGELAVGGVLGAGGGLLSRYLQNLPKEKANDITREAEKYINKSIKPTVKGKQSQTAYRKFIDDTMDVTNYMSKNKDKIQFTNVDGEIVRGELPKTLRETSEALGNLKKHLYDTYNGIAQQAGDKGARVNVNNVYNQLDDLLNDIPQNIANPDTKKVVEQFKNALINYTDDAGEIAIDEAQQLTQDFNNQLTAFFRNPTSNDVSKASVIAKMNKWIKESIDNSIDDVLSKGIESGSSNSAYYNDLKSMYSKIKTIEDEVAKRALVEGRKNTKGLSSTMIDALAGGEIAEAVLTANPAKLAKALTYEGIKEWFKNLNSPDANIKRLFNLVDSVNYPTKMGQIKNAVGESARTVGKDIIDLVKGDTVAVGESARTALSD